MPTWRAMESFVDEGLVRSIGVSNFEAHHLAPILEQGRIMPAVNQIESHPYFTNRELHRFNAEHGIITEAWAPLARGAVLANQASPRLPARSAHVNLRWFCDGHFNGETSSSPRPRHTNAEQKTLMFPASS